MSTTEPNPATTTTGAVASSETMPRPSDDSALSSGTHDATEVDADVTTGTRTDGRTAEASAPTASTKPAPKARLRPDAATESVFALDDVSVTYAGVAAVRNVDMHIGKGQITAYIGPSGCGKSTLIRCLNRMNDLIPTAQVHGTVAFHGVDLYGRDVDPVEVRRRIGMVFQKPNPFPRSIYDNITFGPKLLGRKNDLDDLVEESLRKAALWEEVRSKLTDSALSLSGGQQQRLCIARAIATQPEVILMDEPCSALDPVSTAKVEELMTGLVPEYSIVIVTHNMQQAARVSDKTAFFTTDLTDDGRHRYGSLVEFDDTSKLFTNPSDERTESYITGRFG